MRPFLRRMSLHHLLEWGGAQVERVSPGGAGGVSIPGPPPVPSPPAPQIGSVRVGEGAPTHPAIEPNSEFPGEEMSEGHADDGRDETEVTTKKQLRFSPEPEIRKFSAEESTERPSELFPGETRAQPSSILRDKILPVSVGQHDDSQRGDKRTSQDAVMSGGG